MNIRPTWARGLGVTGYHDQHQQQGREEDRNVATEDGTVQVGRHVGKRHPLSSVCPVWHGTRYKAWWITQAFTKARRSGGLQWCPYSPPIHCLYASIYRDLNSLLIPNTCVWSSLLLQIAPSIHSWWRPVHTLIWVSLEEIMGYVGGPVLTGRSVTNCFLSPRE